MPVLEQLAAHLVAQGVADAVGTDLFLGTLPTGPDACLTLRESQGLPSQRRFGSAALAFEFPRVQVVARGTRDDYQGPRELADAAYTVLGSVMTLTLGGTFYRSVTPVQPPFILGKDDNGRVQIAFTVQVDKDV